VSGEVEHDRDVAALAGEARAGTSGEHRHAVLAAASQRGHDVVGVAGEDHADGHLAVVRAVGGEQRPAAAIEADLPADLATQRGGERPRLGRGGLRHPGTSCWRHLPASSADPAGVVRRPR
jgi:hypothetical protein